MTNIKFDNGNIKKKNFDHGVSNDSSQITQNETIIYRNKNNICVDLLKKYGTKTLPEMYQHRFTTLKNEIGFFRRKYLPQLKQHSTEFESFTNSQI